MSMQVKTNVREYFSSSKIDPYTSGALFKLNNAMANNRFCKITSALTYTDLDHLSNRDKFYEIRQLLTSFNTNKNSIFLVGGSAV